MSQIRTAEEDEHDETLGATSEATPCGHMEIQKHRGTWYRCHAKRLQNTDTEGQNAKITNHGCLAKKEQMLDAPSVAKEHQGRGRGRGRVSCVGTGDWGLGTEDWGLGTEDRGLESWEWEAWSTE